MGDSRGGRSAFFHWVFDSLVLFFVGTPAMNTLVRVQEFEATSSDSTPRVSRGRRKWICCWANIGRWIHALEEFYIFDHPAGARAFTRHALEGREPVPGRRRQPLRA